MKKGKIEGEEVYLQTKREKKKQVINLNISLVASVKQQRPDLLPARHPVIDPISLDPPEAVRDKYLFRMFLLISSIHLSLLVSPLSNYSFNKKFRGWECLCSP